MCRWSRGEGKFSRAILFWLCWVWKNQDLSRMNEYRLEDSNIVIFHKPVGKKTTTYVLKDQRLRSSKLNQPLKIRFLSGRRLNWAHRKSNHMKSVYFNLSFSSPHLCIYFVLKLFRFCMSSRALQWGENFEPCSYSGHVLVSQWNYREFDQR